MLRKIILAIAVAAATLMAAEVAARLFLPSDWFPEPLTDRGANPENFPILSEIGKLDRPDPSEFRIVVTGGSVAYGWGASAPEKRFVSVLEKRLLNIFSARQVRVINAGVPDFEAVDELTLYLHHLRKMQPDMIVMFTGFNDLWEAVRSQLVNDPSPRLKKVFAHRVVGGLSSVELLDTFVRSICSNMIATVEKHSRLAQWMRHKQELIGYKPIKNLSEFNDDRGRESLKTFLDSVSAFHHAARNNNARFMLVIQPVRPLSRIDPAQNPISRYEAKMKSLYEGFMKPELLALSKREKFPVVDLNDRLSAELVVAKDFLDFCHLSDAGNTKVAAELEAVIRKELR